MSLLQARQVLQLPPRPSTADSDLASALQQAAMQSSSDLDPLFDHVGLRFAIHAAGAQSAVAGPVSLALGGPLGQSSQLPFEPSKQDAEM